jgi:hypothetical protein
MDKPIATLTITLTAAQVATITDVLKTASLAASLWESIGGEPNPVSGMDALTSVSRVLAEAASADMKRRAEMN